MPREIGREDLAYDSIASTWDDFINIYDTNRRIEVLLHGFLGAERLNGKTCLEGGCGLGSSPGGAEVQRRDCSRGGGGTCHAGRRHPRSASGRVLSPVVRHGQQPDVHRLHGKPLLNFEGLSRGGPRD